MESLYLDNSFSGMQLGQCRNLLRSFVTSCDLTSVPLRYVLVLNLISDFLRMTQISNTDYYIRLYLQCVRICFLTALASLATEYKLTCIWHVS